MLNNLLRRKGHISRGRVSILNESYRVANSQSPPNSSIDAELCLHATYNDGRRLSVLR